MDRPVYCAQIGSRNFPKGGWIAGSILWLRAQQEWWDSGQGREKVRGRAGSRWGWVGVYQSSKSTLCGERIEGQGNPGPTQGIFGKGVGETSLPQWD